MRFPSAVARTIAQQAKESAAAAAAAAAKKKAKKIVNNGKGKKKSPTRFTQQALKAFRDDNSRRKRKQVHTAKNNRDAGPAESGSESDDNDARQPFPFEGDEELRGYESGYPSEEEPLPSPKKQKILSKQQPTTSVEEGRLSSDDDDSPAGDDLADDDRSGDDLDDDDDVDDESNGRSVAGFKAEKMSGNQQKRYQTAIAVKTLLALQERKVSFLGPRRRQDSPARPVISAPIVQLYLYLPPHFPFFFSRHYFFFFDLLFPPPFPHTMPPLSPGHEQPGARRLCCHVLRQECQRWLLGEPSRGFLVQPEQREKVGAAQKSQDSRGNLWPFDHQPRKEREVAVPIEVVPGLQEVCRQERNALFGQDV